MTALSGRLAEFREAGCDVLGVSTDSIETHERWLNTPRWQGGISGLGFPLASDVEGTMCRAFGVYVPRQHLALRGLFIIDPNGVLQYQLVHNLSVGRSVEELMRVLESLQMGGLCPGDRQKGESSLDLAQEFAVGRTIGPYRIESALGGGGFGKVYRAHDSVLDRVVALKVLDPTSKVPWQALISEARAAAALNHPNVCVIHAVESTLGPPMIVMEFIEGKPLAQILDGKPLPQDVTARVVRQVALAMAMAHAHGIVHGDLKPANIMLSADHFAKVMDFGMATRIRSQLKSDETAVWDPVGLSGISGTPAYMAPEQARGQRSTPTSDVFSLGLITLEMLSGRRARSETDVLQVLRSIEAENFADHIRDFPQPFSDLLRLALAPDPADRHITMAEIAERLSSEGLRGAQ